jgi:hypothetical protein
VGVAIVIAAWLALAARAASKACASWLLNSAHEKSVATSEAVTSEACAFLVLRAAALACWTFFLIEGSGFFENRDAMLFISWGAHFLLI